MIHWPRSSTRGQYSSDGEPPAHPDLVAPRRGAGHRAPARRVRGPAPARGRPRRAARVVRRPLTAGRVSECPSRGFDRPPARGAVIANMALIGPSPEPASRSSPSPPVSRSSRRCRPSVRSRHWPASCPRPPGWCATGRPPRSRPVPIDRLGRRRMRPLSSPPFRRRLGTGEMIRDPLGDSRLSWCVIAVPVTRVGVVRASRRRRRGRRGHRRGWPTPTGPRQAGRSGRGPA